MTGQPGRAGRGRDEANAWLAVNALVVEHAWLLDSGAAGGLHELYTDDGRLLGTSTDLHGRDEIRRWGLAREASSRRSWHAVSNLRLHSVRPDRVLATSGVTLYRHDGPGTSTAQPLLVGSYTDTVVLCPDGRWRFAERRLETRFGNLPASTSWPAPPVVQRLEDLPRQVLADAGLSRTALRSDVALVTLNWFAPGGSRLAPHRHPFDQLSFVLSGRLVFEVDGMQRDCPAGTALHIPADVPHTAWLVGDEAALNLDVFAPPRPDLAFLADHQTPRMPTITEE